MAYRIKEICINGKSTYQAQCGWGIFWFNMKDDRKNETYETRYYSTLAIYDTLLECGDFIHILKLANSKVRTKTVKYIHVK